MTPFALKLNPKALSLYQTDPLEFWAEVALKLSRTESYDPAAAKAGGNGAAAPATSARFDLLHTDQSGQGHLSMILNQLRIETPS